LGKSNDRDNINDSGEIIYQQDQKKGSGNSNKEADKEAEVSNPKRVSSSGY
jgi:hypothetical protein|tara:strand:+ start:1349 stop:1501 length:153 start_codon:yes stop_codon:yes gene_type:complete